jgi:hypothetical protein
VTLGGIEISGRLQQPGAERDGLLVRSSRVLDVQVEMLIDGFRLKTLPSRLDARELARLSAAGARPAGPPPLAPATGGVIEVERTVSASGTVGLGACPLSVGSPLAGQRVTLRLDGPVAHVFPNGVLARTIACPVPPATQARLRGARVGSPQPPRLPRPLVVKRRVSVRGAIMIGGQKIQVGLPHAGKTAQVTIEADTYQITAGDGMVITAPRKTSRDIKRHKASDYHRPAGTTR